MRVWKVFIPIGIFFIILGVFTDITLSIFGGLMFFFGILELIIEES